MNPPKIGTFWRNKNFKNETIIIVNPKEACCSRKRISYKYLRTGHIGGCSSSQWFYSDWEEC